MRHRDKVKLSEIALFVRGVTFSPSDRRNDGGGTPCLRTSNVQKELDLSDLWRLSETVNIRSDQMIRSGDIIVSSANSWDMVGKCCRVPSGLYEGTFGAFLAVLRPDTSKVNSDFLYHWFSSKEVQSQVRAFSSQTTNIANLNLTKCKSLELELPPVDVQQQIVARIEDRLKTVEEAKQRIFLQQSEVEAMCVAWTNDIFGGDFPVSTRQKAGRWPYVLLSDVARLESGHTPSRRQPSWWGGEIRWLALPDIRAVDGKEVYETTERTNDLGLANSSARLLPKDTVAFSRTASVGFVTLLGREMATSQDFANWICGPKLRPWFLLRALRHSRTHLLKEAAGAIHKTIYMPDLKAFQIVLPPVSEQDRILTRLQAFEDEMQPMRRALSLQRNELDSVATAIVREAFL